MTTLIEPSTSRETDATETMADLLARLGDISPQRVRMRPAPGTATEADVVRIDDHEDRLFELIDGVLVEKCMGYPESLLAMAIGSALRDWVVPRKLGFVSGEAGMMKLLFGQVRIPDVAFVSRERLPGGRVPKDPVPLLAPDLAVEVLSEGNTPREMTRKREEYFAAGTRLVWIVDLQSCTVTAYTAPDQFRTYTREQTLEGDPVLPGFSLSLTKLFAEVTQ
jgi:Uma2 family endonuclease